MDYSGTKVIVFDFDGVIVDSNVIKKEVMLGLFPGDARRTQIIGQILSKHPKATRFLIIRETLRRLGTEEEKLEDLVYKYSDKFREAVRDSILEKGFFKGVPETLRTLKENYKLYINSSTPREALDEVVDGLKIRSLFDGIYGRVGDVESIVAKQENLKTIFEREKVNGEQTLFVGDGEDDRETAEIHNCKFIGIKNEFNKWQDENFPLLIDINNIPEMLSVV